MDQKSCVVYFFVQRMEKFSDQTWFYYRDNIYTDIWMSVFNRQVISQAMDLNIVNFSGGSLNSPDSSWKFHKNVRKSAITNHMQFILHLSYVSQLFLVYWWNPPGLMHYISLIYLSLNRSVFFQKPYHTQPFESQMGNNAFQFFIDHRVHSSNLRKMSSYIFQCNLINRKKYISMFHFLQWKFIGSELEFEI